MIRNLNHWSRIVLGFINARQVASLIRDKYILAWISIALFAATIGVVSSLATYKNGIDMGDGSTFYQFAHNLSEGEAIYDDFIHFRTPGSYAFQALFIKLFGDTQSSVNLALRFEASVMYSTLFVLAAYLIFGRKKYYLGLLALLAVLFLPAYLQIRAGLALLAIGFYIHSIGNDKKRYLWATGITAGLTFCFGQETAAGVVLLVLVAEVTQAVKSRTFKSTIARLLTLFISGLVGILPLVLYVLIYANFSTFVYYVIYYAFILQPKGMDVDFPEFGYANLIYFLPFFIYLLCFFGAYMNRKFGMREGIIIAFGIIRLLTMLGRTDVPHVIFIVPEIFVVSLLVASRVNDIRIDSKKLIGFIPYAVLLSISFALAIYVSTVFIFLSATIVIVGLCRKVDSQVPKTPTWAALNIYMLIGLSVGALIFLLAPFYISTAKGIKSGLFDSRSTYKYEDISVDPVTYREIMDVKEAVDTVKPETIFSFPIQPFYYQFAEKHAARFMTFEPQTTLLEQEQTITDLKRTRPGLIVMDPLQAESLSKSVWKITDYVMDNYEISKVIQHRNLLWILKPRDQTVVQNSLVFELYRQNNRLDGGGVQSREQGIDNAVHQTGKYVEFSLSPDDKYLNVDILRPGGSETYSKCGSVQVTNYDNTVRSYDICENDETSVIAITEKAKKLQLVKLDEKSVLWNRLQTTKEPPAPNAIIY